jgi:hypothetical protein
VLQKLPSKNPRHATCPSKIACFEQLFEGADWIYSRAGKIQNSKNEVIFGGLNCQKSENPKSNPKLFFNQFFKYHKKGVTFLYLVPSRNVEG